MHAISQAFTTPPPRFVDVGHSQLAYRRFGSGPDLVFVHGWPLSSATWRDVVQQLAPHFTCHLLDLPGTGHTRTDANAPAGLRSHAQALLRAIDLLELDRFSLVAHDSGGGIARYAAADAGARVQSMVLAATEIPGHHSALLRMFVAAGRLPTGVWQRLMRSRWLLRSRMMLGSCFADPRHIDGDFDALLIEPLRRSHAAMDGQLRLLRTLDPREVDGLEGAHARIAAPTLLVWGTDDPFFPIAKARAMASQFAGPTEFVSIEGARTFLHDEMPERFGALALRHLRAHHPAAVTLADTGS